MVHIWSIYPWNPHENIEFLGLWICPNSSQKKKWGDHHGSSPTFWKSDVSSTSPERHRSRVDLRCQALCGSEVSDSLPPAPGMLGWFWDLGWSSVEKTSNKRLVCCLMKCSISSIPACYIQFFVVFFFWNALYNLYHISAHYIPCLFYPMLLPHEMLYIIYQLTISSFIPCLAKQWLNFWHRGLRFGHWAAERLTRVTALQVLGSSIVDLRCPKEKIRQKTSANI